MTSRRTRDRLIQRLRSAGIVDEQVLQAMTTVPRHLFVEEALATRAYEDTALPIGHGQTISQPYVVAIMTQALLAGETPVKKVLEVGTGCGYQAAVLAELVPEVYTVERIEPLLLATRRRLWQLGYRQVKSKLSDGTWGWAENAPYDGILVAAAPEDVPQALLDQLAVGGRLVLPLGGPGGQDLLLIERMAEGYERSNLGRVSFVPMVAGQVTGLSDNGHAGGVPRKGG